ncbi:MAG TPA: UDP-2,3-diacylglucosamine diphosphatase [Ignavibacteriaceae bacterium]|nr:UDP-2,3-diacylglucosamine diphosphatase [Ignavibacteriaceae bacterium]
MNESYLFISDIHLGLQSKELENLKERLLVKFLNFAQNNCTDLFIVGDLFDYWFEYKRVYQKGFFRTLTALQDITDSGIKLHYLIGNHDFMHRNFFKDEIGAIMYEKPISISLSGKKFFIGHGDGMVKNDLGYKILKSVLRNKGVQEFYSWIHPDIGVSIASSTSKTSRDYTSQKDYGEEDGLFEAARIKIDEGYDYVLLGHLHRRCYLSYKNGVYVNLGSWLDAPCYGIFKDNKFEIVDWK